MDTIPIICSKYNSGKKCNMESCDELHVCLDYIADKCKGMYNYNL